MDIKKWKVRTRDGNTYGPADTETIKRWIEENRVSIEDDVSPADIEEWKKPAEINEFATAPANQVKTDFLLPPAQERTLTTQVVSDGWEVLKADMFPIIGIFLLYVVVVIAASIVPFIGRFSQILITGPLVVGLNWYCLGKIRKQEIGVSALFDGFKIFFPALGAYLLITIFTGLGMILLIIPGIILAMAYSFAYLFMIDKNMGPWEAMKASFDMTKGFRWRILAISMLCSLINILGLLCLGVGILVTIPLNMLAIAALYQRLSTGNIHESQKQTDVKEILLGVILPLIFILGILAGIMVPALGKARNVARRVSLDSPTQIDAAISVSLDNPTEIMEVDVKRAMSNEGQAWVGTIRTAERVYFAEHNTYTANWADISGMIDLTGNKYFTTAPTLTATATTFTATVKGSGDADGISVKIDQDGTIIVDGL